MHGKSLIYSFQVYLDNHKFLLLGHQFSDKPVYITCFLVNKFEGQWSLLCRSCLRLRPLKLTAVR